MKTLYLIGGTMGVGKTTVSQQLKKDLANSVFLDGDWCWDADPFQVTDETKEMVMDNICYLLNNFLHCSAYENVIFCWVMHEQSIVDEIVSKLDTEECRVIKISLIVDEANLRKRLLSDIANKIRTEEIMDKSIARIQMYQVLDTVKIDTSNGKVTADAWFTTQNLNVQSDNGKIELMQMICEKNAQMLCRNGKITVNAEFKGESLFSSNNGNVELAGAWEGTVTCKTNNGKIQVTAPKPESAYRVEAHTDNGSVYVNDNKVLNPYTAQNTQADTNL